MKRAVRYIVSVLLVAAALAVLACPEAGGGKPETKYSITFDANGGSFENGEKQVTLISPTQRNVENDAPVPTHDTLDFMGFYTEKTDGDKVTSSTPFGAAGDNFTVYARWGAKSTTYTVTFNKNDGSTGEAAVYVTKTVTWPETTVVTLPDEPSRTGYIYKAWNTAKEGLGDDFEATTIVNADITVYAQWGIIEEGAKLVTFDKNHSDTEGWTEANPKEKQVPAAVTTVDALPVPPTRKGYIFNGWNTAQNGTGDSFTAATAVDADITVYAQWRGYVVTFDKNGGTTEASPTTKTVTLPATTVGTLPTAPTRTDYTFLGWYTTAATGGDLFLATTTVTGDITVYARWASSSTGLKLRYTFSGSGTSVTDETGNGYTGTISGTGGAKATDSGLPVFSTGTAGVVSIGGSIGTLIQSLKEYTMSSYVYIAAGTDLATNEGHFVWCFANTTNATQTSGNYIFFGAKISGQRITTAGYGSEKTVATGNNLEKGIWKHVMYKQTGTTNGNGAGTVYIDGVEVATGTGMLLPSQMASTTFNYLARPCFTSDKYLINAKLHDFRIYNTALSANDIDTLGIDGTLTVFNYAVYKNAVDAYAAALTLGDTSQVINNLTLPSGDGNVKVEWSSSNTANVSNTGVVTRPAAGSSDVTLTLTAVVKKGTYSVTKTFTVTVLAQRTDAQSVAADKAALTVNVVPNYYRPASNNKVAWLPSGGAEGTAITWVSSDTVNYPINNGRVALNGSDSGLTLTATIKKGSAQDTKTFSRAQFTQLTEDQAYAGYLFVYFRSNSTAEQQVYYALSDKSSNARTWRYLNNNNKVVTITGTITNCIRDPYILRAENGTYYMVGTDMDAQNGWSSNYAILLAKSTDLINWTFKSINIKTKYTNASTNGANLSNIKSAWAPQVYYDEFESKYMVYFSAANTVGDYDDSKVYYTYANADFTDLESKVTQLLLVGNGNGSDTGNAAIDSDIVYCNGKYYLFYKTEGWRTSSSASSYDHHVVKAESRTGKPTGPYWGYDNSNKSSATKLEDNPGQNIEGSSCYRLIGTGNPDTPGTILTNATWYLMYDCYNTPSRYDFTVSTNNLTSFTRIPDGGTNGIDRNFNPRHGCVVPLTASEMAALRARFPNN